MGRARTGVGIQGRVLAAVGAVGDCIGSGADWRIALCDQARALVNCTMGVVGEVHGWDGAGGARPGAIVDSGLDDSGRAHFVRYLVEHRAPDPFLERLVAGPRQPGVTVRRQLVDDASWYGSAYFAEYRKPARVDDMLMIVLAPRGTTSAFAIGLHRGTDEPAFDDADRRAAELLGQALRGWTRCLLGPQVETRDQRLPTRLRQVLPLIAEGRTNKDIAHALGVTTHTAEMHVRRLMNALKATSRTQVVRIALEQGLIEIMRPPRPAPTANGPGEGRGGDGGRGGARRAATEE
jgi:DNA-binding CsgD family transcriptional regulator